MALNLWFEHVIDAFLAACAEGRDWREAVAAAERAIGDRPRKVLTQRDLKVRKGIPLGRQRVGKKVKAGTFPPPFQLPNVHDPTAAARLMRWRADRQQRGDQPDANSNI